MTRRMVFALGVIPLALVVTASAAWGYFSSQGAGTGTAMVGSLAAPTGVTATPAAGTVAIVWTGVASPGIASLGYYVTRSPVPSGAAVTVCGTPSLPLASSPTTCSDLLAPVGTYTYRVMSTYATWTAASAPSANVVVGPLTTTTTLDPSSTTATYGSEQLLTFAASVTSGVGGSPTGTVDVTSGATALCTIVLPDPSCSPDPAGLAASGTPYLITATYSGDGTFSGSSSGSSAVTVYSALAIITTALATAWAGETGYSQTILATGGYGALTWARTVGQIPPGLHLDRDTGILAGTLLPGDTTATVSFSATDANGAFDQRTFTVTVTNALVHQISTAPAGDNSSFTVSLTGGVIAGHTLVLTMAQSCTTMAGAPVDSHITGVSGDAIPWTKGVATGCTANGDTEVWYGLGTTTGGSSTKITVTLNATSHVQFANVTEYTGITGWDGTAGASATASGSGVQVSSGTSSPSTAGELLVAGAFVTRPTPNSLTGLIDPFADLNVVNPNSGFAAYVVDATTAQLGLGYTQTVSGVPSAGAWSAAITAFTLSAP